MAYKRRLKFDKRIRFKKRMDMVYILLLIVLASIGTGYAYIRSDLNVNGTANVTAASWDVHFDNLQVTTGSVTATTPASITDDTTVEFSAELEEPNDFYEFLVDVVNDGTMDAMIDSFSISPTLTTAQAKYLEYTVAYSNGAELKNKQELRAGTTKTLKVRFSYKENDDKTNYPTEDQTFTMDFDVDYVQADGSEIEVELVEMFYRASGHEVFSGSEFPSEITRYNNPADAAAAYHDVNFCLKHVIRNGLLAESYSVFIITPEMANENPGMTAGVYELRGYDPDDTIQANCPPEYYNSSTDVCTNTYYDINKAAMLTAFGSSRCSELSTSFYCEITGLMVNNYFTGSINARDYSYRCTVDGGGDMSSCIRYIW